MSNAAKRHLGIRDFFLITLALLALGGEILLLLHQMRFLRLPIPTEWDPRGQVLGEVVEKSHQVRQRGEKSLSWFPVISGDKIFENDSILTGPKSTAKIKLSDKVVIEVEAETLIRFSSRSSKSELNQVLNINLQQGRARLLSGQKPVSLQWQSRLVKLEEDSQILISQKTLSTESHLDVKKGEIRITALNSQERVNVEGAREPSGIGLGAVSVKAGESIQIDSNKGMRRMEASLKIKPQYPASKARIVAKNPFERIVLYWQGDEGEQVELSRDSEFLDSSYFTSSGKSVQLSLPPGHYFWRARREIAYSSTEEFTILPAIQYHLKEPLPRAAFKEGMPIRISWDLVEGATSYWIEISPRNDFAKLLLKKEVAGNSFSLPAQGPGSYFWRIRAANSDWGDLPYSEFHSFIIKRNLDAPKPKGVKILPERSSYRPIKREFDLGDILFPNAWATEKMLYLEFMWEPTDGASGYRLEVAQDPNFHQMIRAVDQLGTVAALELPLLPAYYWRVAARDDARILYAFSPTQVMDPSASKPKPSADVLSKILAKQSEGLQIDTKNVRSQDKSIVGSHIYAKTNEPGLNQKNSQRDGLEGHEAGSVGESIPKSGHSQNTVERQSPWLPQGVRLGGGILYTEQRSDTASVSLRHSLTNALLLAELFQRGSKLNWDLTLIRRSKWLSAKRTDHETWWAEFLLRGVTPLMGGSLVIGGAFRQDWEVIQNFGRASSIQLRNYYPILFGATWKTEKERLFTFEGDLLVEGDFWGETKGVGLWGRCRVMYPLSIAPLIPGVQMNFHPNVQWFSPNTTPQVSVDGSVLFFLSWSWS